MSANVIPFPRQQHRPSRSRGARFAAPAPLRTTGPGSAFQAEVKRSWRSAGISPPLPLAGGGTLAGLRLQKLGSGNKNVTNVSK